VLLVQAVHLHGPRAITAAAALAAAAATLAAAPAAIAARAATAAALAVIAATATNAAAIATITVLHGRERLLRWRPHLHQERMRCRRHGAWLVRHDCV